MSSPSPTISFLWCVPPEAQQNGRICRSFPLVYLMCALWLHNRKMSVALRPLMKYLFAKWTPTLMLIVFRNVVLRVEGTAIRSSVDCLASIPGRHRLKLTKEKITSCGSKVLGTSYWLSLCCLMKCVLGLAHSSDCVCVCVSINLLHFTLVPVHVLLWTFMQVSDQVCCHGFYSGIWSSVLPWFLYTGIWSSVLPWLAKVVCFHPVWGISSHGWRQTRHHRLSTTRDNSQMLKLSLMHSAVEQQGLHCSAVCYIYF